LLVARSWREAAWSGSVLLAGLAGFLLPIVSQLPRMFAWLTGIATHTGTYGAGERGWIDPARYMGDLWHVTANHPILLGMLLVSIGVGTIVRRQRADTGEKFARPLRLLWSTVGVQVLGLLLIAKHPHQAHYALPLALSCALNLVWLGEMARAFPAWPRRFAVASGLAAALVITLGATDLTAGARELRARRDDELAMKRRVDALGSTMARIDYYRCSSVEFALYMGNSFAWRWFSEPLAQLHPRAVFFNIWNGRFENFAGRVPIEQVLGERPVLVFGSDTLERLAPGISFPVPPGWQLTRVERGQDSLLFRVERGPAGIPISPP
jgi:hypothetical protein